MRLDCKSTVGGFDSLHTHMSNNKENTTFTLVVKGTKEPVLTERTAEPFVYSTYELAQRGKRALESARKVSLQIVPA